MSKRTDSDRPVMTSDERLRSPARAGARPRRAVSVARRGGAGRRRSRPTGGRRRACASRAPGDAELAGAARGRRASTTRPSWLMSAATGARRASARDRSPSRLEVEQVHGDLHAADAVGDGVVQLHARARPGRPRGPRRRSISHSGRARSKPCMAIGSARSSTSRRRAVAGRPYPPEVVVEVEVGVDLPARRRDRERVGRRPAGAAGGRAGWRDRRPRRAGRGRAAGRTGRPS